MKSIMAFLVAGALLCSAPLTYSQAQKQKSPKLETRSDEGRSRTTARLVDEIRHQLVTLPYYDVFDWLEGEVKPDGTVVLRGAVTDPVTKSDAEKRVRNLEGVARVENQIEVLPVSPNDDQIRRQVYREIFKFDSPLFMYGVRAVPPIHIIVNGGRVTLKGVVRSDMDRQLAEMAARQVPGTFDVKNELAVENPTSRNQ